MAYDKSIVAYSVNKLQEIATNLADERGMDKTLLDDITHQAFNNLSVQLGIAMMPYGLPKKDKSIWIVDDPSELFPKNSNFWTEAQTNYYLKMLSINNTILTKTIPPYIVYLIKMQDENPNLASAWMNLTNDGIIEAEKYLPYVGQINKAEKVPVGIDGIAFVEPDFGVMDDANSFGAINYIGNRKSTLQYPLNPAKKVK